jgi:hypothetical protein
LGGGDEVVIFEGQVGHGHNGQVEQGVYDKMLLLEKASCGLAFG